MLLQNDNPVPKFLLFTCTKLRQKRAYSELRLLNFMTVFATTLNFITSLFDLIYLIEIINMESQMLERISHIRNISNKKITIDRIVVQINDLTATNWDLESVNSSLN